MKLSSILAVGFGGFILFIGLHTMWKMMWFLSNSSQVPPRDDSSSENILISLWIDACLVLLFIVQHSWLKTRDIEKYLAQFGFSPTAARGIYVLFTSLALQVHE